MANLTATPTIDDDFDSNDEPEKYDFFRFLPKSKCPMNKKKDTNATTEALLFITPEQAKATLALLAFGYADKAGAGWGPAERNLAGCVLTKKAKNLVMLPRIIVMTGPYANQSGISSLVGQRPCRDLACCRRRAARYQAPGGAPACGCGTQKVGRDSGSRNEHEQT